MPRERTRRRLAHEAGHMFDLVADVERYPDFVPGCRAITIRRRRGGAHPQDLVAEMVVGYGLITERFTCRVTLDRPALAIDVDFIDGPFTELSNAWRFHDLGDGTCEVDFTIDFKLTSRSLGRIVAVLFDRVFLRFVDAFEKRADALAGAARRRSAQGERWDRIAAPGS
jgi:coenzyme Q-binding protein COQ10